MKLPAPSKQIIELSRENQFFEMEKRWDVIPYPSKPSMSSMSMIVGPLPSSCSMHPRRKNCYRTSCRSPVTVKPARVHTIHSAFHIQWQCGRMQPKHQIHPQWPVNMNCRTCANPPAANESTHHRPRTEKSCCGRTGKCLDPFFPWIAWILLWKCLQVWSERVEQLYGHSTGHVNQLVV